MPRLGPVAIATLALFAAAVPFGCSLVTPLDDSAYGEDTSGSDGGCPVKFCDDFERTAVQGGWTSDGPTNGGSLVIVADTAAGSSHGRVLEVTGCADSTVNCAPSLKLNVPVSARRVTYAFDVRTNVAATAGNFSGIDLGQNSGPDPQAFLLLTGGASCSVGNQVGATDVGYSGGDDVPDMFPAATWTHVEMDFVLDDQDASVQVLVDGALATSDSLPKSYFAPAPFAIIAGVFYSRDTVQYVYDIDNVAVDYSD